MTYINQMPMYEPFLNTDTDNLLNIFKTVKHSSDNKKKVLSFLYETNYHVCFTKYSAYFMNGLVYF